MKERGFSRVAGLFRGKTAGALAAGVALTVVGGGLTISQASAQTVPAVPTVVLSDLVRGFDCGLALPGQAHCMGKVMSQQLSDGMVQAQSSTAPRGLTPSDIQSAYSLTGKKSTGTVAIVDAYDDPNAESDLATYRRQFGLPACTTANGCFHKVNQHGKTAPLPKPDKGWAGEISLDLDAVSAACPTCKIDLVEGDSASMDSLGTAVDTAAKTAGVASISNSYGGNDSNADTHADKYFRHPGVAITASTGDNGYGVEYPAASPTVTAVGGTSLRKDTSARGWTETAWSGTGSGCSTFEAKPLWQHDNGCTGRTVADVAADADPTTGLAIYDSYQQAGWLQAGGTSLASPLIASVYALAGNTSAVNDASLAYSHLSALHDVTAGSNGNCTPAYLCTAGPGYDGPTGLGTPNGTGAF